MSVSAEMNTRVTQYMVLQWVWNLLRRESKADSIKTIYSMLALLSAGVDIDFEELTKELKEGP